MESTTIAIELETTTTESIATTILTTALEVQTTYDKFYICLDLDENIVDKFGLDCVFYNTFPGRCGFGDSEIFTANVFCCECGGGTFVPAPTNSPTGMLL